MLVVCGCSVLVRDDEQVEFLTVDFFRTGEFDVGEITARLEGDWLTTGKVAPR